VIQVSRPGIAVQVTESLKIGWPTFSISPFPTFLLNADTSRQKGIVSKVSIYFQWLLIFINPTTGDDLYAVKVIREAFH
jgi:hypothetical protein